MSNSNDIMDKKDILLYKKACGDGDYKKLVAIVCKYYRINIIKQLLIECDNLNLDDIFNQAGHYGSIKIFAYFRFNKNFLSKN
jgi:hypothetical protein